MVLEKQESSSPQNTKQLGFNKNINLIWSYSWNTCNILTWFGNNVLKMILWCRFWITCWCSHFRWLKPMYSILTWNNQTKDRFPHKKHNSFDRWIKITYIWFNPQNRSKPWRRRHKLSEINSFWETLSWFGEWLKMWIRSRVLIWPTRVFQIRICRTRIIQQINYTIWTLKVWINTCFAKWSSV